MEPVPPSVSEVLVRRLDTGLPPPAYAHPGDAGAYELNVDPGRAVISSGDDAGLQYGLTSLWQLATQTQDGPAPIAAVRIADAPRSAPSAP